MATAVSTFSPDFPPALVIPDRNIPGSTDGGFRPMRLLDAFLDPVDTFRAVTIADTFFIVPDRELFDSFEFDVGIPPDIGPFVFSIQNKTINTTLRVNLTLPSYLRSNLGTVFDVPFIGDTTTPPIQSSEIDFVGSGTGLINVSLTFSEAQARTFTPGNIRDEIIFDIFNRDELTGPVFVSTLIQVPVDLNPAIAARAELSDLALQNVRVPVDGGDLDAEFSTETVTTASVQEVEFAPLTPEPFWTDGTDGQLKSGSPPAGWITEADGRAYPPLDTVDATELETTATTEAEVLSPIEQLFAETNRTVVPSFGSETSRKGFIVDVVPLLTGVSPSRIIRQVPQLLVGDSVPSDIRFKIVNWSDTFPDGNLVPNPEIDSKTREYFDEVSFHVGLIKQDEPVPFSFATAVQSSVNKSIKRVLSTGEQVLVPDDVSEVLQQNLRIIVTAVAILKQLTTTGGISPTTDLSTQVIKS